MKRSLFVLILIWLVWGAIGCAPAAAPSSVAENAPTIITVYKSPTCGCCDGWIEYAEKHGYRVRVEQISDVTTIKNRYRIPAELQSCHTSLVGGYVVEGHVPVEALAQLLAERPSVKGIAVPGMPIGAPGMEQPTPQAAHKPAAIPHSQSFSFAAAPALPGAPWPHLRLA